MSFAKLNHELSVKNILPSRRFAVMLAPWDPIAEMASMRREMDRMFSALAGGQRSQGQGESLTMTLPLDVSETEQGYQIQAPLPGFKSDQVEVTARDGMLTIRAHREEEQSRKERNYVRRELSMGSYVRQLSLPSGVDTDAINARFEDGMLTVEVPKMAQTEPKKIEVAAGSRQQDMEGGPS
jgi:HSP20 family protein